MASGAYIQQGVLGNKSWDVAHHTDEWWANAPLPQRLNVIRFQCEVDYELSDGLLALCNCRLLRDSRVGVGVSCDP